MKYKVYRTNKFDKQVALCKRRGYNIGLLKDTVRQLAETGTLPRQYKPHELKGKEFKGCMECHILPDWLLVWKQNDKELTLLFTNTGTHSDLF